MEQNLSEEKVKQYQSVVIKYISKDAGHIMTVTDDRLFNAVLRNTLTRELVLGEGSHTMIADEEQTLKTIINLSKVKRNILIFIERVLNHKETGLLIKQVKNAFPHVKIIVLTGETESQQLTLLHEIGADNFITKPVSLNTLIEKIAFTIKPQGKIGQAVEKGKKLLASGNPEGALEAAREILKMKPNSAAAFLLIGDAFKAQGKRDLAEEFYSKAGQEAPMYLEPLKKLAELHKEDGDRGRHLKYLEKLDDLSPLNVDRKVEIGGIHVERGNDHAAEELFASAMKLANKEAASHIGEVSIRIGSLYAKNHPAKAESYFRAAIDAKRDVLDKSDIKTFNNLGIALRKQGKWRAGLDVYQKALEISPEDENLYYNMAMAFYEGKLFRQATERLDEALKLNPEFGQGDAPLSSNMGVIFIKGGEADKEKARRFLEKALELDPSMERPQKLLAQL
jgi:tetratricopeptide (TPR) repeat protein